MLQQEEPEDFVIATGVTTKVRDFVDMAFRHVGIEIEWQGCGVAEKGIEKSSGRVLVEVDPRYFRPTEVELLLGDPAKARQKLGWQPETNLQKLVSDMMNSDLESTRRDEVLRKAGHKIFDYFE
jgi:GDPmannose 4,6-dehydratase